MSVGAAMPRVGAFSLPEPVTKNTLRPAAVETNITALESLPAPKPIPAFEVVPIKADTLPSAQEQQKLPFVQKCKNMWAKRKKVIIALIVIISIAIIAIAIAIKVAVDKNAAKKKKKASKRIVVDQEEEEEEEEQTIRGTKLTEKTEPVSTLRKIEEGVGSIKRIIKGTPLSPNR